MAKNELVTRDAGSAESAPILVPPVAKVKERVGGVAQHCQRYSVLLDRVDTSEDVGVAALQMDEVSEFGDDLGIAA